MKTLPILAISLFLGFANTSEAKPPPGHPAQCRSVSSYVSAYRSETWHWQRLAGQPQTRAASSSPRGCRYLLWTRDLWWKRKVEAKRSYYTIPETRTWTIAVRLTQRVYPGTSDWLLYISRREGGWGSFVMNHQGSGAGGWMQFMASTFYAYVDDARAATERRGFAVPRGVWTWTHPLGQALTAGYMRYTGRDGCHWCL